MEKVFKGYPLDEQESAGGVVNDTVSGRPVVAVYNSDAQTGMAYLDEVDGQTLEFYNVGKDEYEISGRETDSSWDVHGRTVEDAYGEARLEFVPSFISEWYGWSGYHPETQLYRAES